MAESRIRRAKSKGYFALNREPAQDERLSLEARGLYALMMSLPDDWDYTVSGMAVKAGCGKSKVRRCLKEMEDVGYLLREQSHDSGGKFSGNVYILQEFSPLSENTDNGENRQRQTTLSEFGTQQNIDLTEDKTKEPPIVPQGGRRPRKRKGPRTEPDWKPERFAGFWAFYPRKGRKSKQSAMDAWDKLHPDDALIDRIAKSLIVLKATDDWQREVGIPYVATFLNNARWQDAEEVDGPQHSPQDGPTPEQRWGWD